MLIKVKQIKENYLEKLVIMKTQRALQQKERNLTNIIT